MCEYFTHQQVVARCTVNENYLIEHGKPGRFNPVVCYLFENAGASQLWAVEVEVKR